MKAPQFEDLFAEELQGLYDAENRILKALPKMVAAASSEQLAAGLQEYLEQTEEQIDRLKNVFESMGGAPEAVARPLRWMLNEAERRITKLEKSAVRNIVLIAAVQKLEL